MVKNNRRQFPRIFVSLTATYRSPNLTIDASVENLSQAGLFIASSTVEDIGTSAELVLDLPGRLSPLILPCSVAWSSDIHGMGLRFSELPRDQRAALANFIMGRVNN